MLCFAVHTWSLLGILELLALNFSVVRVIEFTGISSARTLSLACKFYSMTLSYELLPCAHIRCLVTWRSTILFVVYWNVSSGIRIVVDERIPLASKISPLVATLEVIHALI